MHAGSPAVEELANRAIRRGPLEELDPRLSELEEGYLDPLRRDILDRRRLRAEDLLEAAPGRREVRYCDAHVIEPEPRELSLRCLSAPARAAAVLQRETSSSRKETMSARGVPGPKRARYPALRSGR